MIPELDSRTGFLPVGRHPASIDEVTRSFALTSPDSTHRNQLWEEWLTATTILMQHVRVGCAWLGGSFLSTKELPDDIDVAYWIEDVELVRARADPTAAGIVEIFTEPARLRSSTGLRVDAYLLPWTCNPLPYPAQPAHREYNLVRGYWDDLWLRSRSGPKGAPPVRLDALPRRGYLEVILDGFDE